MVSLEQAIERILSALPPPRTEVVSLAAALDRYAAVPVAAPLPLPPFDNSAMDGYAVRAEDVAGASHERPVTLKLQGRMAAGESTSGEVSAGGCVRVFTGSMLPPGADAVVMQEDTETPHDDPTTIRVLDAVRPWENVRLQGEDVKAGAAVLTAGERVSITKRELLSALGVHRLSVGARPAAGFLATGNELQEAGEPLRVGHLYECNRLTLAALAERAGARTRLYPLAPDTLLGTRQALEKAFAECDLVVTTGGVSVGESDLVKETFAAMGGELAFWRVAMRPGKPFVFGRLEQKFLFGLPGNPVSAFVTFLLLVRPAILRWQGAACLHLPLRRAVLGEDLANPGDRRHFARVRLDEAGRVRAAGLQASHALSSLANATGLVDVPPHTTWRTGTPVDVLTWE
jgi:molybdopterin molybdotransferase